ncbi:hypothetical protein KP77_01980 [Jeotgalibacillus alimentarius]|uniref:DUF2953 domain-containing protein n=1 Tax=Jeotgalibacillus alimentarius TaxID=135826 RepID=A0A0C2VWG7_9BACL|nr:hypothetical protein [Jeotgalibacillus alimentarius]KIL53222.1 hypothetical protein KP77_01980 [Jeotgalibacillus alimentarius]
MIKLLFLLCLPFILFVRIKFAITAVCKGKSLEITINMKVMKLLIKRWHIPIELSFNPEYKVNREKKMFTKNDLQNMKTKFRIIKEKIYHLKHWAVGTLKGFSIDSFQLSAGAGLERPDWNAWLNGGIAIAQALFVQQLSRVIRLNTLPQFSINPGKHFSADLSCIISVSAGHLIRAGMMLLIRRIGSRLKKREKAGGFVGASN